MTDLKDATLKCHPKSLCFWKTSAAKSGSLPKYPGSLRVFGIRIRMLHKLKEPSFLESRVYNFDIYTFFLGGVKLTKTEIPAQNEQMEKLRRKERNVIFQYFFKPSWEFLASCCGIGLLCCFSASRPKSCPLRFWKIHKGWLVDVWPDVMEKETFCACMSLDYIHKVSRPWWCRGTFMQGYFGRNPFSQGFQNAGELSCGFKTKNWPNSIPPIAHSTPSSTSPRNAAKGGWSPKTHHKA